MKLSATLGFLLVLAGQAFGHEEIENQIRRVTGQIEKYPSEIRLYLVRGDLYRIHREWSKARADFDRAQGHPEAKYFLAQLEYDQGDYAAGYRAIRSHLDVHSLDWRANLLEARLLMRLERNQESAAAYTRAIKQAEEPKPEMYLERSRVEKDLERALAGLDEGLQRLKREPSLLLEAVDLEVRRKEFDRALQRLDSLLNTTRRKETWTALRGEILLAAGRKKEARQTFLEALMQLRRLKPKFRATEKMQILERKLLEQIEGLESTTRKPQ